MIRINEELKTVDVDINTSNKAILLEFIDEMGCVLNTIQVSENNLHVMYNKIDSVAVAVRIDTGKGVELKML